MLTAEENELLCRVEGDAPMGQLMRRHWIPVCMAEEVPEADGTPLRAKLLGQELVVFRDSDGRLGVLDEHCPHRGASLVYGRNEEGGLRCLYHGWKFDVEGTVMEMPSEPAASSLANKTQHRAYPAREGGGYIWVYMGPAAEMPEFQMPAWAPSEDARISIVKIHAAANWAQTLEGGIDSAHSSNLHASDIQAARVDGGTKATAAIWARPTTDKAPRFQSQATDYGFRYAAIRRPIQNASTQDYVRITEFIAPFTALIPPNNLYNVALMNIPLDDTNTMYYFMAWSDKGPGIDQEAWRKFCGAQPGIDLDSEYKKLRNRGNHYQQDRKAMKLGNFTGIHGIPNQDMAMWESMAPIVDRSRDRLGASDLAIVEFRRIMVDAVKQFRDGGKAIGADKSFAPNRSLAAFEGMVPKGTDWRTLLTTAVTTTDAAADTSTEKTSA